MIQENKAMLILVVFVSCLVAISAGLTIEKEKKEMSTKIEVTCPECGSTHVAISHTPLCGSPAEKVMVFWAVCNEVECRQQFHVLYDLVPSKTTKLEKERWLKL